MTKKEKKASLSHIYPQNRIKFRGAQLAFSKNQSDDELVLGVQNGSEEAFAFLYHKYEGKLMGYLFSKIRNKEIAEEIFQVSWSKALDSIHTYKLTNTFSSWLFTIASNTAKDWYKKISNQNKVLESLKYINRQESIDEGSNSPLNLDFLRPVEKKIIELQYIMGLSSKEISNSLDLSDSNVRKISSRAKKEIKTHILNGGGLS